MLNAEPVHLSSSAYTPNVEPVHGPVHEKSGSNRGSEPNFRITTSDIVLMNVADDGWDIVVNFLQVYKLRRPCMKHPQTPISQEPVIGSSPYYETMIG